MNARTANKSLRRSPGQGEPGSDRLPHEAQAILEQCSVQDMQMLLGGLGLNEKLQTTLVRRAEAARTQDDVQGSPRLPAYLYIVTEMLGQNWLPPHLLEQFLDAVRDHIYELR